MYNTDTKTVRLITWCMKDVDFSKGLTGAQRFDFLADFNDREVK